MEGFIALTAYILVVYAALGGAQLSCWPGSDQTLSNTCWYDITCAPIGAIASGYIFPPDSTPTSNCAAAAYTCSSTSYGLNILTDGYFMDVTCTSDGGSAATSSVVFLSTPVAPATSTVVLPTAPTLTIPIPASTSLSSQTVSALGVSSMTSISTTIQSSTTITPSEVVSSSVSLVSSSTAVSNSSSSTYPGIPTYTGGDLLRNYCVTPEFTLLPGPQSTIVIYAAFIGCVNDKPDCCPFVVSAGTPRTTTTISATATVTRTVSLSSMTTVSSDILSGSTSFTSSVIISSILTVSMKQTPTVTSSPSSQLTTATSTPPISTRQIFPTAAVQAQATLSQCPQDYHMVSSSCCPKGYILYSTAIAGITPCYSPLLSTLNVTPPPGLTLDPTTLPTRTSTIDSAGGSSIPSTTLSTTISAPLITTSISNNVYYSVPFPVQPPSGSNISKGDIVAISLCSFIGISALASWFLWRRFWQKQGSGFKKHGYTVVWIAPLEIEALAAKNMLENIHHDVKFPLGRGDDFIYTAGDINGHNIIIATFPSGHCYGVGAGASLATDVRAKFPDLLFGLLVGVAGGLPELSKAPVRDIRLGDVLVAEGQNGGSSIVRYGFGKETEHKFQVNLVGSKTAAPVASGIGAMKRFSLDQWISFRQYYQSLLAKDANNYTTFRDPGQNKDQYFATSPSANNGNTNSVPLQREPQPNDDSIQVSSQGPDGGNPNPVPVPREERPDDERIKVWYGKIGSGDTLMKNARRRDELKEDYEIIGLEMEAAGVMDVIPVGVIRGVCDYADERKNKAWQSFAAATAAAYAKALLYTIDPDPALNRTVPIGSPRG